MRTNYITTFPATAETSEPPQPTPIPVRIVTCQGPTEAILSSPATTSIATTVKSDDFYSAWLRFTSAETRRAKTTSRSARMVQQKKALLKQNAQSTFAASNHVISAWDSAVAECRVKVAAIVEECRRLNKKYRDAVFDLEGACCMSSLDGSYPEAATKSGPPPWVKRVEDIFENPVFLNDDAPFVDVHQQNLGDCWLLASLISVSAKKDLFKNLFVARDEEVGVYGFVFYRDGEWIYEVIDDKLYMRVGDDDKLSLVRDWGRNKKQGINIPLRHQEEGFRTQLQTGGEALYFSYCASNETWLPLIEKAYAKAHGDYHALEGGHSGEAIEDLTGGVSVVINPEDIMNKDRFWAELMKVNKEYLFGGCSKSTVSKNIQENHAYAVLEAWEGDNNVRLLKLRNPWGETEWNGDWSDGSKLWTSELLAKVNHTFGDDGIFWMSYDDFLKHFPAIHRTRLFDESWYTSQQWTSVDVPWTVDYLDTRFEVTVKERGPAVFVISQPDDRYFRGIQGRYSYSLYFRVYSSDDTPVAGQIENARYIVRSLYQSGDDGLSTRSVSAEVEDLEAGKYSVIFKITGRRWDSSTADEVIRKYAVDKKEKLLQVGRRFDYAQTKGNLHGLERANRLARRKEKQDEEIKQLKRNRRIAKKQREQLMERRSRIESAKIKTQAAQQNERPTEARQHEQLEPTAIDQTLPVRARTNTNTDSSETLHDSDSTIRLIPSAEILDQNRTQQSTAQFAMPEPEHRITQASEAQAEASRMSAMLACNCSNTTMLPRNGKVEELVDNDFDWDSDLDKPIYDSDRDTSEDDAEDLFEDDPWNARCVVGLRVYSRDMPAEIEVIDDLEEN